ncbi:uncharacterized protein DUF4832 [Breznakia blatticola]|uniref:Uncharacterized protein DUF4832 n=1 Tax=Breznakia blatticola TaxID=1754012 RepID=A0A4R7ZQ38_9FIRM|nr:DUF4874 domain-containing protein [Breznakia blatticola]TDW20053.1 uncharacterized protein DUF4832 [Breznakia blatticola]
MDKLRRSKYFVLGMLVFALIGGMISTNVLLNQRSLIPKEKTYDFNVKSLDGNQSMLLQENPNRGYRMEVYLNVETNKSLFEYKTVDAIEQLENEIATYKSDNPKLIQVYFYLTGYKDKDLDDNAFKNMNAYFDKLKEHDLKAIFRFAYVSNDSNPTSQEPTLAQIQRHMVQVKPFIEEHKDQIHVFQAGIVGAWGEWDSGAMSRIDNKAVMDAVLAATPKDMQVQVRYSYIKENNVPNTSEDYNRVAFHDDFLIGVLHSWNTAGADRNATKWKKMTEESKQLLVDGEMIWGSANGYYTGGKAINAYLIAQRMKEHHFTSLSMTHNYKEQNKEQGKTYSMAEWQHEYVNQAILDTYDLPYDEAWFMDADGNNIPRNMFEYLRDYLGYYLKVESATATVKDDVVNVSVDIANYGFSAPHKVTKMELVLLDAKGTVVDATSMCKASELQPGNKQINVQLTRPDASKPYMVAIRAEVEDGTTIRFANDLNYVQGNNVLGILK